MRVCLCLFLIFISLAASAQAKEDSVAQKNLKIFPIPIAFYTPETGLGLGAGITSVFRTEEGAFMPRKSQLTLGFAYTTMKQTLLYVPYSLYLSQQRLYLYGEVGYFNYVFRYFGITNGEAADSIEFYRASFPRVRFTANYQVANGVFVGPKVAYDAFNFRSFDAAGRLAEGDVAGSEDHEIFTVGLGLLIDKRDNNLFPTGGYYLDLAVDPSLNADYPYVTYTTDLVGYIPWSKRGCVAFNYYMQTLVGEAPFTALPRLGGTKKLRGYFEGSILQKSVMAFQVEARRMIIGRFGAAVFAGVGMAGAQPGAWSVGTAQASAGGGLRVRLTDKLNARVDYAFGLKGRSGFYLTFGEAF